MILAKVERWDMSSRCRKVGFFDWTVKVTATWRKFVKRELNTSLPCKVLKTFVWTKMMGSNTQLICFHIFPDLLGDESPGSRYKYSPSISTNPSPIGWWVHENNQQNLQKCHPLKVKNKHHLKISKPLFQNPCGNIVDFKPQKGDVSNTPKMVTCFANLTKESSHGLGWSSRGPFSSGNCTGIKPRNPMAFFSRCCFF